VSASDPVDHRGSLRQPDAGDHTGLAVQQAEDAALPGGGRQFPTAVEMRAYVDRVTSDPWWNETFPWAPCAVDLRVRSRSATFSAAHLSPSGEAVIFIRRGSFDAVTVIHELAHVAARSGLGDRGAHDAHFITALSELWRRHLGVFAWAALDGALRCALGDQVRPVRSPVRQRERRRSGTSR
jgi:putative metallohydrolase (TIGR04338 family)